MRNALWHHVERIEPEFSRRLDGSEMPDREAAVRCQPDPGRGPGVSAYLLIVLGEYVLAGESAGAGRRRSSTRSRFSISREYLAAARQRLLTPDSD